MNTKTTRLKNVCVYCGSGQGRNPAYGEAAELLGKALAAADLRLVYGGGNIGLMGLVARAARDAGGAVTGIIPAFLSKREIKITGIDELVVVDNMHERKMMMYERSDAFVALPGGIGTLEELVEQLTWAQLGHHRKPIVLANVDGFWSPFLSLLEHMREETFIRHGLDVRVIVVDQVQDIIPRLEQAVRDNLGDEEDGENGVAAKF